MSSRRVAVALAVLVLAATIGVMAGCGGGERDSGPGAVATSGDRADWSYVIPAGTGRRLGRGERVEILPGRIDARVGETIRIENRDGRGYLLGPFYVGPRETLVQEFVSPGTFRGECVIHPSGEIIVDVTA